MSRVLIVAPGELNPELVAAIQRFRGAIYAADGAVKLEHGRHIEAADERAYHLVLFDAGEIRACLRYQRRGNALVRLGGWAVAEDTRKTRAGIRLVFAAVRLAEQLGDRSGFATVTTRHASNEILKRLGGEVLMRYWDSAYGCEMEYLTFSLAGMRQAQLKRAQRPPTGLCA